MAEYLIGYDLRFPFADFVASQWPEERRELFLLRPEIQRPASVDVTVWPSRFVFPGAFVSRRPDGLERIQIEIEHILQRTLDLWPDLEAMQARWRAAKPAGAAVPVAITLVGDEDVVRRDGWPLLVDAAAPIPPPGDGWTRVGYDVGDDSLLSGLANCGFASDEVEALRQAWTSRLNDHGLFDALEDADAFRRLADARVPEHRPFRVYGLYRGPS